MQYVVSSPSRTGSTLLCQILKSAGVKNILHTHNPLFVVDDPKNTVLLFSLRRDLFRSIMSCLVGKRTQIYNLYDKDIVLPEIQPFEIECVHSESEFQKQYRWHKYYVQSHDISKSYCKIETFYLEDFANDYDKVYRSLGLDKEREVKATVETSYKYKNLVLNHEQCKEVFDQLEKTSVFVPILKPYDPNLPN